MVNDKNIVEYREVTLGAQQPNGMQVVEPIKIKVTSKGAEQEMDSLGTSDKINIGGLQRVRDGVKVRVKNTTK